MDGFQREKSSLPCCPCSCASQVQNFFQSRKLADLAVAVLFRWRSQPSGEQKGHVERAQRETSSRARRGTDTSTTAVDRQFAEAG